MSILIVDDSALNRKLIESFLSGGGYTDIDQVESAQEAFDVLSINHPEFAEKQFKLILMDIMMPEIDGIKACKMIKNVPYYSDIPIIMVTAKSDPESLQSAFDAGAMDYITKPIEPIEMMARVRSALLLKEEMDRRKASQDAIIDIGAKIQQTLLFEKSPANIPNLEISAYTIPSYQIDGDFYDFYLYDDRYVDVLIGDVMGKGVLAALVGAATKSHFAKAISYLIAHEKEKDVIPSVEKIIQKVHSHVSSELIELETFITLCYARFDIEKKCFYMVDCGHTKTIHYNSILDECNTIKGSNFPLGVVDDEQYSEFKIDVKSGDIIFFYSDGITEARNKNGELFGEKRLINFVKKYKDHHPEDLIQEIQKQVASFTQSNKFSDDLTYVAIKIQKDQEFNINFHAKLEITSNISELKNVRDFIKNFCIDIGGIAIEKDFLWQIELGVVETVSNIMKHSYKNRIDKKIEIVAEAYVDKINIFFHHWGDFFSPPDSLDKPSAKYQENGFGLYIIKNCVDEINYSKDETGKKIINIVKKFKTE